MYTVNEVSDPSHFYPELRSKKNFQPVQSPHVLLLEAAQLGCIHI